MVIVLQFHRSLREMENFQFVKAKFKIVQNSFFALQQRRFW